MYNSISILILSLWVMGGIGCQGEQDEGHSQGRSSPSTNSIGKVMPLDAAPPDRQVYRFLLIEPTTLDANIAIYKAQSGVFPFEGLTRLNHDFELVPAAAERWESSPDGTSWTFYLRKDAKWSDGRPVTAHDFEYTFKRAVDPASANVYAFFYYPIKGAKVFSQGKTKDRDAVGVRAIDDYTLVIETEGPCPYLPQLTAFTGSECVPRRQIEKYGEKWTEPEYCVTNSTFRLGAWRHGEYIEFNLNPYYNGPHKAYLERIIGRFVGTETEAGYLAYENDEVDYQIVTAMNVPSLRSHPVLGDELHMFNDFATRYLIFDTLNPPFNNLKVRQAISHAIDRDALCDVVMQGTASPAYSMLPPGYPGYADTTLDHIQRFDPILAKRLLADAGYPDGRSFPRRNLVLRGTDMGYAAQTIQQMLKQHLNIDIGIRIREARAYSTALYQWEMPLSLAGFNQDYPDPHNMLSMVWRSQPKGFGRQSWRHDEFDRLVDQAAEEMNEEKRAAMYADAQRMLVEDVGGVFLFYQKQVALRKPWLKGFKRNRTGEIPFRNYTDIYIGNNKR